MEIKPIAKLLVVKTQAKFIWLHMHPSHRRWRKEH